VVYDAEVDGFDPLGKGVSYATAFTFPKSRRRQAAPCVRESGSFWPTGGLDANHDRLRQVGGKAAGQLHRAWIPPYNTGVPLKCPARMRAQQPIGEIRARVMLESPSMPARPVSMEGSVTRLSIAFRSASRRQSP
jgi:hypothetical protein